MRTKLGVVLLALALAGCGGAEEGDAEGKGGTGGMGGTGGSAGGAGQGGGGGTVEQTWSDLTWLEAQAAFPEPLDHHATFVMETARGPFLYVAGGGADRIAFLDGVRYAQIYEDGTLGLWADTLPLPESLAGAALATSGDHVYLMAGMAGGMTMSASYAAKIGDDGGIVAWAESEPLPDPRFHAAGAAYDRWIYVVGGLADNVATDTIYRAELDDAGNPTGWAEIEPLPAPRSHEAVLVHDGWLYVLGGLSGNPMNGSDVSHTDVWRAKIGTDGSLGAWETLTSLPVPLATESAFVAGGSLWIVGGLEQPESGYSYSKHVRRAPLAADGSIGDWVETVELPRGRAHVHQTPVYDGHVYSIGGSVGSRSIDSVWIGTFAE